MNNNLSTTLVFIDSNVANYKTLAQQVNPGAEVVILDSSKDGIEQITQALKGRENIASLQIVSHGGEGEIQLGNTLLNREALQGYSAQLQQWGDALSEDGDILLYGCSVAVGKGTEFVEQLSQITGADVAASDNLTGSAELAGDWELEVQTGEIEASQAIEDAAKLNYDSVLAVYKVDTTSDNSNTGSLRWAIEQAKNSSETDVIDLRGVSGEITLNGSLPTIDKGDSIFFVGNSNIKIDGQDKNQIISINGNSNVPVVGFQGIEFEDGLARGGDGQSGGGGGLGAGGAMFIYSGSVVVDNVTFDSNKAKGGDSNQNAGSGGADEKSGSNGGNGGSLNANGNFQFGGGSGGSGGSVGSVGGGGGNASFGAGGGGGGGGGGGDDYGHGGGGGGGGFGAGGGGGGGGGNDHDGGDDEDGDGGKGGARGDYGGNGAAGAKPPNSSDRSSYPGGRGGGGAGLGGAIFGTRNVNLTILNSNFTDNSVEAGYGVNNGSSAGNAILIDDAQPAPAESFSNQITNQFRHISNQGLSNNTLPTISITGNPTFQENGTNTFTLNATNFKSPVKVYYFIDHQKTSNSDFQPGFTQVRSIDLTQNSQSVSLPINDDQVYEGSEAFSIRLLPSIDYITNNSSNNLSGTITDNEPVYSIEKVTNGDGIEGGKNPQFKIIKNSGNDGQKFKYIISHVTSNNDDFEGFQSVLEGTFPTGKTENIFEIQLKEDQKVESPESFKIQLAQDNSYGILNNPALEYKIFDNEPRIQISKLADKTEGEDSRVADIFKVNLLKEDGNPQPNPQPFDLTLRITGDAVLGSFADPKAGSDYKLFYTAYGVGDKEVQSRQALLDPIPNTTDYKISIPKDATYIKLQAEDINDELFEVTESINVELRPSNPSDTYYRLINTTASAVLRDNEPTVSLGKVVNPTEGLGFGSTIAGLEEAITFTNKDFLSVAANSNLNLASSGKFTQEAWIFPNFTNQEKYGILGYSTGDAQAYPSISLIKQPDGKQASVEIGFGDGNKWNAKTVNEVINPKTWNHIATTFDGKNYKLYVNAVEIFSTDEFQGKSLPPTQQLEIGKAGNNSFEGAIDEVRIWNFARNAGEIQQFMLSQLEGYEEGLVGYWNFNGNTQNQSLKSNQSDSQNVKYTYINNPAPQIGYVEVNLDKPFQGPQGLWVKYDITGGDATRNTDYFNSRYRKVSTDATSERNGIIIPQGETTGRIYFSALSDAVVERDETIAIKLVPHNFDNEAGSSDTNSNYKVGTSASATITIQDNQAFKNGIILLDEKGQVVSKKNPLVIRKNQANFSVQLSSQPTSNVTVNLSSNQGSLNSVSRTFTAANWDIPQAIALNGVNSSGLITASTPSNSGYFSGSTAFDFTTDAPLRVTEGSATDAIAVTPEVTIFSQGNITENDATSGKFVVNLSAPAPQGGVTINYTLSGDATADKDYQKLGNDVLKFDGQDDGVEIAHHAALNITNNITLEARVYLDEQNPSGNRRILQKGNNDNQYRLLIENNQLKFDLNNVGSVTAPIFSGLEWHHVAGVYDGSKLILYVDGALVGSTNAPGKTINATSDSLNIGTKNASAPGGDRSKGQIDEVRIWNVARTPSQIEANQVQQLSASEAGLIAYYQGNATGNAVIDSSTLNKNGALKNGASIASLNSITIPEGAISGTIAINPIGDKVSESDETVIATLSGGKGYTIAQNAAPATLKILDDDKAGIKVVNAQTLTDENGNTTVGYSDNFVQVVTSEPYPNVGNVVEIRDVLNGTLLTKVILSQADITAGKVSINLPGDQTLLQTNLLANLKETNNGNVGAVINNSSLTLNDRTVEVKLPSIANQAAVGIRLETQPTADVTISLKNIDGSETSLDKTTLTFTPQNWDTYQQVKITGVDDLAVDGAISYQLQAEVTDSQDPNYKNSKISIDIQNLDDDDKLDDRGISVKTPDPNLPFATLGSGITVAESDNIAQIQVNLSAPATQDTNVIFDITDGSATLNQDYQLLQKALVEQFEPDGRQRFTSPFDGINNLGQAPKLTFADLNNDGDLDAIIGTQNGINYYENIGGASLPNFEAKTGIANPFDNIKLEGATPTLGDLNGDRTLDLVVGTKNGSLNYYINTGTLENPRFSVPSQLNPVQNDPLSGINAGNNSSPVLVDFNNDGKLDLITGSQGSATNLNTLRYYQNTGTKSVPVFTQQSNSVVSGLNAGQNSSPVVIDWDRDGDLDLLVGQTDGSVRLFSADGNNYATNPEQLIKVANSTTASPAFADLDGDGDLDAFVGTADGKINYYEQFSLVKFAKGEQTKTINLKLKDDRLAEGNETVEVTLFPNAGYQLQANPSNPQATVTITDNDVANVIITPTGNSNTTSESGNSVSYKVKLNSQPTAPVTVYLGTQDETEALVSNSSDLSSLNKYVSLNFTPDNWDTEQTFYVKGVDDFVDDGDLSYKIITTVSSEDRQYHRLNVNPLSLTNTDDDQVGFLIAGAGKAVEGRENVYSVRLKSQPVGEVRLIATPTNDQIRLNNKLVGEPLPLTFNSGNWNFDQTVRAIALDDSVVEYLHNSEISFKVETGESLNFESKADNNLPENALDLGTIKGGYKWSNLAISDADIDWFKFTISDTANAQDFVKANFNHGNGNLKLELYAASDLKNPIQEADSSSNSQNFEQISLEGKPFGEYYLKVSGNPNNYDLLVADEDNQYTSVVPANVPVVIEDNDIPTVRLVPGETASEVFGKPSYFTFQLNAPTPANGDGMKVKYRLVGGTATFHEDINGNGSLDPGEDINKDGSLNLGDYRMQTEGFVHIAPGDIQNNLVVVPIDDKLVEDLNLKVTKVEKKGAELILTVTTPSPSKDVLSLDGTNDYVEVKNHQSLNITNAITVESQVYLDEQNFSGNRRILQKGDNDSQYRLLVENNKLKFDLKGVGVVEADVTSLPGRAWNHVAGVYDGSTIALYVNGEKISSVTASGTINTTTNSLYIGTKNPNAPAGDFWKGQLDEIRIWNVARTPQEIKANQNRTLATNEPNLVGYYPVLSSSSSSLSLSDQSVNKNNGELKNGASYKNLEPASPKLSLLDSTKIKFANDLVATVIGSSDLTLDSGLYQGTITVAVPSSRQGEITNSSPGKISEETVVVELLEGEGYQLPENRQATLRIQDDDVPGLRIAQIGDNTVVREDDTASFQVSLLSEPTDNVTIRLVPGAEIEFVNPVNPTTVNVDKYVYSFAQTNTGNLDVKLNSLVTSEKDKTIAFDINLQEKPSSDVIVELYDANDSSSTPVKKLTFTAFEQNLVLGKEEGNWNKPQQVIIGNLDPDNQGNFALKARIKNATDATTQIGADLNLPINSTKTTVQKQTTEITVSPKNWFKLQTVTIKGIDEGVAEPGLYHQSDITYQVNSNDKAYNNIFVPNQRIDVADRILNAESTAQTIQQGLTTLQNSLDSLKVPLVGSLDGKTPNLIGDISNKLVSAIGGEKNLTANRLKTVIEDALKTLQLDFIDVAVDMDEKDVSILLNVKKEYKLFSLPLDADLGLDALGISLKTEGEIKSSFNFEVGLGFGLHKDFGFYLDTDNTKINAAIKLDLDDFKAQGNLGPLRLDMKDDANNPTKLEISFKAGLNDLDNYQTVKFLDVDGDGLLDADNLGFRYPIKQTPDPQNTAREVRTIQEPFSAISAQGTPAPFPTVPEATPAAKRINWNNNTSFDEAKTDKLEGVYRTQKNAPTGNIEGYYFDFNRNGKLDTNSKENLFSITPETSKWFDPKGSVKPFRIEQKKVTGVLNYYFDKNGNNQLDVGETLTQQEKGKLDSNNNGQLDADVNKDGEGSFIQGTGIAFRDINGNGVLDLGEDSNGNGVLDPSEDRNKNNTLDLGEPYVNSEFGDLSLPEEAIKEVTFLDLNNDGTLGKDDPRVKEDSNEIEYLDLNNDDVKDKGEPIFQDNEWSIDKAYIKTLDGKSFIDLNNNGLRNVNTEPLVVIEGDKIKFQDKVIDVEFIDLDKNNLQNSGEPLVKKKPEINGETTKYFDINDDDKKGAGEPTFKNDSWKISKDSVITYDIKQDTTDPTRYFLDQDKDGKYTEFKDINLSDQAIKTLKLTKVNGEVVESKVTFVDLNDNKELDLNADPLVLIKQGVRFVDLDGNGSLTLNNKGEKLELFSEQNNQFDETKLAGTGKIIKLLNDGSRLTLTELKNFKNNPELGFSDLFSYEFAGTANLGLVTKTSVKGDPAFPSIAFNLGVGLPLFNYGNQKDSGSNGLSVDFKNIKLDFGTFLTKFVNPVIKTVDEIISPVKPVLDIINADTKLFSYLGLEGQFNKDGRPGVSLLDIGATLAEAIPANTTDPKLKRIKESVPKAIKFVNTVTQVVDLVDSLKKLSDSGETIVLELGSYNLDDFKAASDDPADASSKTKANPGKQTQPAGGTPTQQAETTATPAQKGVLSKLKNLDGLELPILDNPLTAIRILLGESNVDLIKYDIPDLDFFFSKELSFPLWTPPTIAGILELGFEAKTDLSVGYDTGGLEAWKKSSFAVSDTYKVLDGFYLDDLDKNGKEKDEFSAKATIAAGVSASIVVAKAALKAGIDGYLGFDMVDEGELQGKSDGKVRGSEIISRLDTPLELFDLKGQLDAFLKGEIKIGLDVGFFEIMATVWSAELRTTLAKFNVGASGITFSSSVSNSYINEATVFFDGNANDQWDEGEPITFTNEYGQYNLNIGLEWDKNSDQKIDQLDGQIIAIGGFDTSSGSPSGKIIGLPGSTIITPLTSIQVPLVQSGLTPEAADTLIKQQLSLDPNFKLETFDSLNAVGQDSNLGLDIYLAHIQVQALFNHGKAFLDGLEGTEANRNNQQLVQDTFAKFLKNRADSNLGSYNFSDRTALEAFFTFLAKENSVVPTPEQLQAIAQIFATSNDFLNQVAKVGASKSLPEALPALASVKRVVQGDLTKLTKDIATDPNTVNTNLQKFEEILYQNYTLVSADINAFGNRSVKVTSNTAQIAEGEQGKSQFVVELSHPAPNQGLSVFYSVSGTATLKEDYQVSTPKVGELYIEPGSNKAIIEITAIDDQVAEALETVTVNLQSVGEGYLIDPTGLVALVDIKDDEKLETTTTDGETKKGGLGQDNLVGTAGNDRIEGLYGDDTLNGLAGDDIIKGGHGNDLLDGGAGNDRLEGNFGSDTIDGGSGNDIIDGGSDSDRLMGGAGIDILKGSTGDDYIEGNAGNDQIEGGSGDDILLGNEDNDWLVGGEGNDILIGGTGDDILNGGQGKDVFFFNSATEGFDTLIDFNPKEDKIQISAQGFGINNLNDFRFINGVLDFQGQNLSLIQNNGQTYSYFPDLSKILEIVDEPTAIANSSAEQALATSSPQTTSIVNKASAASASNLKTASLNDESVSATNSANQNLLEKIKQRGVIRISVPSKSTPDFDTDFARAIAAALFGDATKVEIVPNDDYAESFQQVADKSVDLSVQRSTYNLLRDASLNVDFGPVYLYDHQAILVKANSSIKNASDLKGRTIGLSAGATSLANLKNLLTPQGVDFVPRFFNTDDELFAAYNRGEIDAVSTDSKLIESHITNLSEHHLLELEFSKEPIAMALPENESEWADVVRWVTYATIQAEEFGINSQNIDELIAVNTDTNPKNDSEPAIRRFLGLQNELGKALGLPNDFAVQVIKQVGNYGDIYQRSFGDSNRDRNFLSKEGGLIYSLPFSGTKIDITFLENDERGLLAQIKQRGKVAFGLPSGEFPGFVDKTLKGFDVDLGRAIAAAVFGDANKIEFVRQKFADGFANTANGVVDVSAGAYTENLVRDASMGIDFSPTYLYGGQGILTRVDSGISALPTLNGRKVGVVKGTTAIQNLTDALVKFDASFIPVFYDGSSQMYAAYDKKEVDAVFQDITILAGKIPTLSNPKEHQILQDVFSKEPLGLLVDQNQSDWADVVRWVTHTLVQAEEYGITKENIDEIIAKNTDGNSSNDSNLDIQVFLGIKGNAGEALDLPNDFAVKVIKAVGNYGEMYQRNFNTQLLPRSQNELFSNFGLQYAPPLGVDAATSTTSLSFNPDTLRLKLQSKEDTLKFSLDSKHFDKQLVHEVAIVAYDNEQGDIDGIQPGQNGYLNALLKRAEVIFSVIPDNFVSHPSKTIQGFGSQNLGIVFLQDTNLEAVLADSSLQNRVFLGSPLNANSSKVLEIDSLASDKLKLSLQPVAGATQKDLVLTVETTQETVPLGAKLPKFGQNELLDLRDAPGKQILAEFPVVASEAAYDNIIGFYQIEDTTGAVKDPLTGKAVRPGESGYEAAAIRNSQKHGMSMNDAGISTTTVFEGGKLYAPYLIANNTVDKALTDQDVPVYFAFMGANPDKKDHILSLGNNTWGFEDLPNGGDMDFNDIVIQGKFTIKG